MMPRFITAILYVGLMVLGAGAGYAQNFPTKPIRIVTAEPGGGNDVVARMIAQRLSATLGQQVIVDNRPSGVIPAGIVGKSPPDGYTLLVTTGVHWLLPLMQKVPFDPVKDFAPITLANTQPSILVVHPSVAAKSVKELIDLAKAKPGALNYDSGASGTSSHLGAELFKSMAGVNIVRIPYKAAGPAVTALIGGEGHLMFANAAASTPHIKSGKLRALAIASAQPSALAPGLPTVAASGLPGFESVSIVALFAPAKTPDAIVRRLNREIVQFLILPDIKEKFLNTGSEVVGSSPEALAAKMRAEVIRMGKVIKDAGIRAE